MTAAYAAIPLFQRSAAKKLTNDRLLTRMDNSGWQGVAHLKRPRFTPQNRIGPKVDVPGLDELALCDVVEVLDRVGAPALGGFSKRWRKSRKARAFGSPAMAEAYRIISTGRMQETLDAVYDGFLAGPDHASPSLTSAYGWFYHWYNLRGNQRFSRYLTEEVYHHAASRFRIDRRAMRNKSIVVSQTVIERMDAFDGGRLTLSGAAAYCGCHLLHLRKLATAYGLMRTEKSR